MAKWSASQIKRFMEEDEQERTRLMTESSNYEKPRERADNTALYERNNVSTSTYKQTPYQYEPPQAPTASKKSNISIPKPNISTSISPLTPGKRSTNTALAETLNQMYAEKKNNERSKNNFDLYARAGMDNLSNAVSGIGQGLSRADDWLTSRINQSEVGRGFLGTADAMANALGKNAFTRGLNSLKGNNMTQEEYQATEDQRRRALLGMTDQEDYTFSDNAAQMVGGITGQLTGMFTGTKALNMGANLGGRIASNALVAGTQGAARSYGEGNTGEQVTKDALRDALFYAAGTGGSELVGNVLGTAGTKAGQLGIEALKGLAFDATGYAATMPTYGMTGDQAPTGKEIATDMITGALFDFIPNVREVMQMDLPTLKKLKTSNTQLPPEIEQQINRRLYDLEEGYSIEPNIEGYTGVDFGTRTRPENNYNWSQIDNTQRTQLENSPYGIEGSQAKAQGLTNNKPYELGNKFDYKGGIDKINPNNKKPKYYEAAQAGKDVGNSGKKIYNYYANKMQNSQAEEFLNGYFDIFYNAGKNDIPYDNLPNTLKDIPEYAKEAFYNAGANDKVPTKEIKKKMAPQVTKQTKEYEAETKELLNTNQKEVYEYLKEDKDGKKAKEYYLSPELTGVDRLKEVLGTNEKLMKFTDNKNADTLDSLQKEMANQFPEVEDLGMEEFAQYLVDTVNKNRVSTNEVAAIKKEAKALPDEKKSSAKKSPIIISSDKTKVSGLPKDFARTNEINGTISSIDHDKGTAIVNSSGVYMDVKIIEKNGELVGTEFISSRGSMKDDNTIAISRYNKDLGEFENVEFKRGETVAIGDSQGPQRVTKIADIKNVSVNGGSSVQTHIVDHDGNNIPASKLNKYKGEEVKEIKKGAATEGTSVRIDSRGKSMYRTASFGKIVKIEGDKGIIEVVEDLFPKFYEVDLKDYTTEEKVVKFTKDLGPFNGDTYIGHQYVNNNFERLEYKIGDEIEYRTGDKDKDGNPIVTQHTIGKFDYIPGNNGGMSWIYDTKGTRLEPRRIQKPTKNIKYAAPGTSKTSKDTIDNYIEVNEIKDVKAIITKLNNGEATTLEEVKNSFEYMKNNEAAIKQQLKKDYTIPELKKLLSFGDQMGNKPELIDNVFKSTLSDLLFRIRKNKDRVVEKSTTQEYLKLIDERLSDLTQEELDAKFTQKAAEIQAKLDKKKTITNKVNEEIKSAKEPEANNILSGERTYKMVKLNGKPEEYLNQKVVDQLDNMKLEENKIYKVKTGENRTNDVVVTKVDGDYIEFRPSSGISPAKLREMKRGVSSYKAITKSGTVEDLTAKEVIKQLNEKDLRVGDIYDISNNGYEGKIKVVKNDKGEVVVQIVEAVKTLEGWKNEITDYDLNYDTLYDAYRNQSFTPDTRAEDRIKEYKAHMESVYKKFAPLADTPEKKEMLLEDLENYKQKYINKLNAYMNAKAQTASTAITGRDGFNYARNEKKMATEQRRKDEFIEFDKKALKAIERKLSPEQKTNETDRLKKEILSTAATIKSIKEGNYHGDKSLFVKNLQDKIKRSANNGNIEEVKQALAYVKELQEEHGITIFANNNSIWKAVETYSPKAEAAQAKAAAGETEISPGIRYQYNAERNGIELFFDSKPDEATRTEMKQNGFRWAGPKDPSKWYAKDTPKAQKIVENFKSESDSYGSSNFSSTATGPKLGAATGANTGTAKKGSEIFESFGEKLGMTIKNDKRLRGALGTQNYRTGLTNIKKANDIPVLSHETGHYLDNIYKFNSIKDSKISQELIKLGENTSRSNYSPDRKKREGIAEFMRLYLTDPNAAIDLAPNFSKHFISTLPKDTLKVLDGLQQDIWDLTNLSPGERLKKTISFRTDYKGMNKVKKNLKKAKSFDIGMAVKQAYTGVFDKTFPMEWAAGELGGRKERLKMRDRLGVSRGSDEMSIYNIEYAQTDYYGKEIGPSLADILEPIHKNEQIRQDFWTYAAARRGMDYFDRGLEMTDDIEVFKGAIKQYETPEFKKTFDKVQKYNENNLQLLVEAGVLNENQVKAMKEVNPNYIPLNRIQEAFEKAGGKGGSKGVKRLKGGGQDIRDPEENIIMNTFSYRKLAQEKMMWKDLSELADTAKEAGDIMVKASLKSKIVEGAGQIKATALMPEEGQAAILKNKDLKAAIETTLKEMGFDTEGLDVDFYSKLYLPDVTAGANQVVVHKDGKPVLYDVHPFLYSTVSSLPVNQQGIYMKMVKALGKVAQVSKTGIIFNPRYVAYNLARDTGQSLVNSRVGLNPIDIGLGAVEAIRKGDTYKSAMRSGAMTGYFNTSDRKYAQEQIDSIMKGQRFFSRNLNKLAHPFQTIGDFIEPGELAARLPEYKKTLVKEYRKQYGRNQSRKQILRAIGNDPQRYRDIVARAAYNARDLSLDFNKSGAWVKELGLNQTNNFFNSQLQGLGKTMRTFTNKEEGTRALLKGIAYITLPSLGIWAWGQQEDQEMYEELPSYRKDFYMNIPLGDGVFFPIPLPYEYATTFSALPRRILEQEMKNDPKAFDGFAESLKESFFGLDFTPTALVPLYEVATNKNFSGSPILSQGDQMNPPELQYNRYTSDLAKKISEFTQHIDGLPDMFKSPKQLDHLLKGYTGTLGSMMIQGNLKDGVTNSFISDARRSPQSMNYYYDYRDQIQYDEKRYKASGTMPDGYSEELKKAFSAYNKQVVDLNDKINELRDQNVSEEEIQTYTDQRLQVMKRANKMVETYRSTGELQLETGSGQETAATKGKYYQSLLKDMKAEAGEAWENGDTKTEASFYTALNKSFNLISRAESAIASGKGDKAALEKIIKEEYENISKYIKTYEKMNR